MANNSAHLVPGEKIVEKKTGRTGTVKELTQYFVYAVMDDNKKVDEFQWEEIEETI